MNKADTSVKGSNIPESPDKTVIINSLTKYLTNETVPKVESLPAKYEKLNLNDVDLNDVDGEPDEDKIFTSLKTVEFVDQNVEEFNTSKGSEDFEELLNLEDVKNIEELESFKESQNFEESIDLEEIKNIEKTEALEVSQNFEESVNFEDIKNIEGSVIIELDNVELSQIQNSTQGCSFFVIEIPSQKSEDDKQSTDGQEFNLINSNFTENNDHEATFTSLQNSENTSESENDQNLSNPILQLSNSNSSDNLRERIKKRKREKVTTTETENNESEVADQKVKSINNETSEIIFVRPITPNKLHNTKKVCTNNDTDEQNISLSSPTLSVLKKNLTDEDKVRLNSSQDIANNSDNEFEEICNFIKNGSYDPAQLSMDTLDLLDEFNEIDQSTNEKLLADLISSPMRISDQIQEDNRKVSTPEIEEDIRDIFEISLKNEKMNDEESNILEPVKDQMRDDNSVEMADDLVDAESQSENEEVSSSYEDDDSSYNELDEESSSTIDSSSEIDIEKLKEQAIKAKKSLVIKKEVREKLAKFTVKLKHEVPPQHKVEKTIRMSPSRLIQSLFEEHIPMKKGIYTTSEDKIIKENWNYFCKVHKWDSADIKPFLQIRYKRRPMMKQKESLNFARFIARGLPSRCLFGVMARFKRLFRDTSRKMSRLKRWHYTAKEDKIILAYFEDEEIHHQDGIKKLAKLLDRPYGSVFYRWQILKTKEERELFLSQKNIQKRVDWDISLVEKFLKKLMKLTLSEDVDELKDATIPLMIWKKLERKMKISINCLKSLWFNRLHAQLFYERPFFLNDIKVLLIEYMHVKGITNREEINWLEIGKLFDGIPIGYLMKVFYCMERNAYVRIKKDPGDVIDWLYEHRINRIKLSKSEKYLPGIIYKDGKIEVIHRSYPTVQDCDTNNSSEDIC